MITLLSKFAQHGGGIKCGLVCIAEIHKFEARYAIQIGSFVRFIWICLRNQPVFTGSKSTMETADQCLKSVQS